MGWVLKNQLPILTKYVLPISNPTHPFTQLFYVCKWSKYFKTSTMIKMLIKMTKIPPNN